MFLFIKRFFDIVLSLLGIIVFSPLLFSVALLILIFDQGPIVIKQKRIGRYNRVFKIFKFKTMNSCSTKYNDDNFESKKVTKLGKILRNSSLDELPQLINVLRGDMSLIGPRPKTPEEIIFILDTQYEFRHCTRPGLTGLAVIRGRNILTPIEAYNFDIEYIKKQGILFDLYLLTMSVLVVFSKKGVNYSDEFSFIPHRDFWRNEKSLNEEEYYSFLNQAKQITASDAKYMGKKSKKDFIRMYNSLRRN